MARFGIVGLCATLVYVAVAGFANEVFEIAPVFASLLGVAASTGVSYFGHVFFSFRVEPNHRDFLWRFLLIAALAFSLSAGMTWLIANVMQLSPRLAITTVTVLIPIINYLCNRYWVFMPGLTRQALAQSPHRDEVTRVCGARTAYDARSALAHTADASDSA
jgi:putative flippase GtrA